MQEHPLDIFRITRVLDLRGRDSGVAGGDHLGDVQLELTPGIVGVPLSSSQGVGAGDAELQSTPMKYSAFADSSLLTSSSLPSLPFHDRRIDPGSSG